MKAFWEKIEPAFGLFIAIWVLFLATPPCLAADLQEVTIGYLHEPHSKIRLSSIDAPAQNDGIAGALLAIDDNNTTGRFIDQHFTLVETKMTLSDSPDDVLSALANQGAAFVIVDLDSATLLRTADVARLRGIVLLNVGAMDDRLREEDCRANIIHVAPSRGMLADGLAQYLVWKK